MAVPQGQGAQHHVGRDQFRLAGPQPDPRQDRGLTHHDALGPAGRARRAVDHEVVGRVAVLPGPRRARRFQREGAGARAVHGQPGQVELPGVAGPLPGGGPAVEEDRHRVQLGGGQVDGDEGQRVLGREAEDLAGGEPLREPPGRVLDRAEQRRVRRLRPVGTDDGRRTGPVEGDGPERGVHRAGGSCRGHRRVTPVHRSSPRGTDRTARAGAGQVRGCAPYVGRHPVSSSRSGRVPGRRRPGPPWPGRPPRRSPARCGRPTAGPRSSSPRRRAAGCPR